MPDCENADTDAPWRFTMPRAAALLALALAGCSSPSKSAGPQGQPPGACAAQVGAYRITFAEGPGGACGPLEPSVVGADTTGSVGAIPPNCTGIDNLTADRCTESIQLSCRLANGNTQVTGGAIDYATDGKSGEGTLQIEVFLPGGQRFCGSVYSVTVAKI